MQETDTSQAVHERLQHLIDHAAHLLPAQGPITVFIHHNTLHAFEEEEFTDAVKKGAKVFGCHPFLPEEAYRDCLSRGRIRFEDLTAVLHQHLGDQADVRIARTTTRLDLRLAMLQYAFRSGPTEELLWFVEETDALRRVRQDVSAPDRAKLIAETRRWVMRDLRGDQESNRGVDSSPGNSLTESLSSLFERMRESRIESWSEATWEAFTLQLLWRICSENVIGLPSFTPTPKKPIRHRDLLLQATGIDSDLLVHEKLIRLSSAYLDQGIATWSLPNRDQGFFRSFCSLYSDAGHPLSQWVSGLKKELDRYVTDSITPLQIIHESLVALGVPEEEWEAFISETFLTLRGWGGMVQHIEQRGDRVAHPIQSGSLVEFLAVRLLLDRFAIKYVAQETLDYDRPLAELRDELRQRIAENTSSSVSVEQRAFLVFQLAQVLGWSPGEVYRFRKEEWVSIVREIETFNAVERRHLFHLAYERRFTIQTLDAIALHADKNPLPTQRPRFQVVTCIDEREESFRRHLEEIAPDAETYGTAGFFAVAMYYRGVGEAHFIPLCPIVIRPKHWVTEKVIEDFEETHRRRAKTRRAIGTVKHQFHLGSRTFAFGAIISTLVGVLATLPLVMRILFPRFTARVSHWFGEAVKPPPRTRLQLERSQPTPSDEEGGIGFSVEEMITSSERILRDIGLIHRFSRLVFVIGHGSTSLNNPHESAHDCGACGGSPGAPNGRAISQMLNDPRVRKELQNRGITIPEDTYFVGGYHNTSDDSVTWYDIDRLPTSHLDELKYAFKAIDGACDRNAHERCRRFLSAPLTLSGEGARQHVEGRAEDLAQTRPEFGHATNAICIVGRRHRTQGLYLDRRAFLVSYDPTQDTPDAAILTRTLLPVFPVCSGINLEYYFSRIDPPGWGCGTKLPHNITSLLGVMDGAASDLRTGLPWQMVEIHEPVRLLFVIETKAEIMEQIMQKHPGIGNLVYKGWVQVALLDPNSSRIQIYQNEKFVDYHPQADELPQAISSIDWYRGWRDHLEFAEIQSK
jgi:uncharacterized protein